MVMTRRAVLLAGTASTAACTVRYVPVPSAATVGVPVGGGVVGLGLPPTWLNSHCIRAMSEQVSWMIGLLPAVEPSRSLTHSPLAALAIVYLPDAAPDAAKDHRWLTFVPSPQPHCCNCTPGVVELDGT